MNIFLVLLAIIAVFLLAVGGFFATLKWLLWLGVVLAIITVIVWLARAIVGRNV